VTLNRSRGLGPSRAACVLVLVFASILVTRPSRAQASGDPLPVAGSLIYHALLYNRVNGSSTRGLGLRFAGRVSIRLAEQTYVGFGGGSWARVSVGGCDLADCEGLVTAQSEAFVYQLYVQQYLRGKRLFVRTAAGLAQTRTLVPETRAWISVLQRWRGVLSAGGGIDLPLARHVYLTPSLDYTVLPGADGPARELSSALAVGLAITLH
jgi:hypothetical protein